MATRYTVGTEPASPLVIHVTRDGGGAVDLSGYADVEVEGDQLPAGTTSVLDAPAGVVERSFDTGFAEAGLLLIRVKLTASDGAVDYSSTMRLPVDQPGPDETMPLFMTTDTVEAITGVLVSSDDVIAAQNVVSLAVGVDLGNEDWVASLSDADQFWLQLAVAYQATETAGPGGSGGSSGGIGDAFGITPIPGVASVRTGDLQVTFGSGGGSGSTAELLARLHPNTQLALRRLSWLGAVRTLHATPFLAARMAPSPWVPLYQVHPRLVR